jgi:hypothetical protein
VQQHQRQQPLARRPRHQLQQHPPESDRLGRQLPPHRRLPGGRRVPLVEDEIDDGHHRLESLGQVRLIRDAVGDAGSADLLLGPHQALGHRRRRDQEGAGDLLGGEASQRAQGQRHLRLQRQRRVAAGEDQAQAIVHRRGFLGRLVGIQSRQLHVLALGHRLMAQLIGGLVPRRPDQPGPRVLRLPLARPLPQGRLPGRRQRVLGPVEVAQQADERGQDPATLLLEDLLDQGFTTAAGTRAAAA